MSKKAWVSVPASRDTTECHKEKRTYLVLGIHVRSRINYDDDDNHAVHGTESACIRDDLKLQVEKSYHLGLFVCGMYQVYSTVQCTVS